MTSYFFKKKVFHTLVEITTWQIELGFRFEGYLVHTELARREVDRLEGPPCVSGSDAPSTPE